jgi:hypothetical protein
MHHENILVYGHRDKTCTRIHQWIETYRSSNVDLEDGKRSNIDRISGIGGCHRIAGG